MNESRAAKQIALNVRRDIVSYVARGDGAAPADVIDGAWPRLAGMR